MLKMTQKKKYSKPSCKQISKNYCTKLIERHYNKIGEIISKEDNQLMGCDIPCAMLSPLGTKCRTINYYHKEE